MIDKLIAGSAVCYANVGETVPVSPHMLDEKKDIVWLPTQLDVEVAIAKGLVQRPTVAVNGKVEWRWPDQPPPFPLPDRGRK
jgi:hypothetical protein